MNRNLPKQQQYPASLIIVGAVLYSVLAYTDDAGKTTTEYQEWIVRSIKAKRGSKSRYGHSFLAQGDAQQRVNLAWKIDGVTWVKRAGKAGWAPSIAREFTHQFRVGDELPRGLYTTQRAALVYAIRAHQQMNLRYEKWIAEETDPEELLMLRADRVSHQAEMKALAVRFKKGWPITASSRKHAALSTAENSLSLQQMPNAAPDTTIETQSA